MKQRTLNEIRQSKEYQQAVKSGNNLDLNVDVAIDEIVDSLNTHLFDIIFQAVNDEMHKYTVFQEQTYLTDEVWICLKSNGSSFIMSITVKF